MNKVRAIVFVVTLLATASGLALVAGMTTATASGSLLHEATLKSGNYGAGTAIPTMPPDHGGSPSHLGIVNSTEGVTFTSTETDGRSNALINWYIADPADRFAFRSHGTVSFMFKADRETHVPGEIFGDNYGFGCFRNGQSALATYANRIANGPGIADDQVSISWATTDGISPWAWHGPVTLEYGCWYHIGIAWGGPNGNLHETWVCGELGAADSVGPIPWGVGTCDGSATNVGLGDNHERGYGAYGSAAGVTFADIRIWNEYRELGDTEPCEPCEPVEIPVAVDVKPMSCPNPLNVRSKGVLPVAILGTEDFDVMTVDPASIRLNLVNLAPTDGDGVCPLRWAYEDVATPYLADHGGCHTLGADGCMDLVLKFDTPEVVAEDLSGHEDGAEVVLRITGNLKEEFDGSPIIGDDTIVVINKMMNRDG